MRERIAIIAGVRTPFCKANGVMKDMEADELGAFIVRELMQRANVDPNEVDEVIFGNVLQPPHATNIARVIGMKGGLPEKTPAFTVNRNCASGLEAIATAYNKIDLDEGTVFVVGGTESMTNFPILISKPLREFINKLSRARGWRQKLNTLLSFRPSFLKPEIPKIADPICGLTMGQTAENVARDFRVSRKEQDHFAFISQERAAKARKEGRFAEEIVPIPIAPTYEKIQEVDDGPRDNQTMDDLKKLSPAFDKLTGSVTAGNSSQVTDGAVALLVMAESKAKKLGLKPLGYFSDYAFAALDPSRMGLGPVFATSLLLNQTGLKLEDFDLVEINEAFAAQVLGCVKAFASDEFSQKFLNRDKAIGRLDPEKLNVNGGAIALGHPLGASGARLVLTMLLELKRRNKKRGLVALCIGGGQGEAALLEVE